ncbi:EF-hand domain pair [Phytophthora infestans]|uniref:EF-hand domain pair n=1 Tax=Phytophthora infestans TaxID=4787 RepID=A0A8S9U7E7_PHYIN|nr:EF-hand domain pair [Phytophthora infestans]
MAPPPPPPRAPPPPRPKAPPPSQAETNPDAVPAQRHVPPPPRGTPPAPRNVPGPPSVPRGAPPGPPKGPPPTGPPGPPKGPPPTGPHGQPSVPRGAPPGPPKDPPPQPPKAVPPPLPTQNEPEKDVAAEAAASLAAIQKLLRRGRLSFTLLEAREIRRKGGPVDAKRFSADAYVKIAVGTTPLSAQEKRSKTLKKSGTPVIFHEEIVSFDLTDPVALVTDGDLPIKIEVFDENLLSDEMLGEVKFSALRFFDGQPHREVFSLSLSATPGAPCGEIEIEIKLEEALVGMLSIVLMEGRNLKSMELIGKQDPYCQLSIGKFTKRGKTIERGGRNPYFGEEELLFWFGDDLWTQQMALRVFDEDIGNDDLIGDAKFSVLHFMAHRGAQEHAIPLRNKGSPAGEVLMRIEFFPAGILTVTCHAARQLRSVDAIGRQDPYVKLTLDGRAAQMVRKTKTDTDGGSEPEWEGEISCFDVVDQYNLQVEVWDEDSVGDDDLIGAASLSLLPIFRYGYADDWLKLWVKGRFGNKDPAGMLRLEMSFQGPAGVAYPQHQAGMDRFTEKERRTKETAGMIPSASEPDGGQDAAIAAKAHALTRPAKRVVDNTSEFSEEELLGAFRFLDLDKNSFIGAAELRHLLICMGELITDAEVDEMVRLCDTDGDGQVSFDEFRRMAIHPDPGGPEFALAMTKDEPEEPVPVTGPDLTVEDKQRQLEIKQEKSKLMRRFVQDTHPSLEMLERVAKTFRQMQHDVLDFEDFCSLFEVEPTGEYRRLFALFTPDNQSDSGADLREILLAAVNFVSGVDRTQRVRFCFEIFDDDHNGFITEDELVNILRANYLASTDDQVRKKAQTILRQADDDGDGRVSLNEFHAITRKFPNLLFPPHDAGGNSNK